MSNRGYSIPEGADEFERAHIRILDMAGLCLNCGEEPDPAHPELCCKCFLIVNEYDPSIHASLHAEDDDPCFDAKDLVCDFCLHADCPGCCWKCSDPECGWNKKAACPSCAKERVMKKEPGMFHDIAESQGNRLWDFTQ